MTSMEHNSAARPVYACGAPYTIVRADREGYVNPIDIARAIRPNTGLIVVNHASNVCGSLQDIASIGKIARAKRDFVFSGQRAERGRRPD